MAKTVYLTTPLTEEAVRDLHIDDTVYLSGELVTMIYDFHYKRNLESYKKGIEMTVNQLLDVFKSLGVEAYGEKGEEFDPNIHNGVMHVDDETLGENVISDVYMKGYKLGDKVIRHATVIVAN